MLLLGKFDGGATPATLASVLGSTKKNFRQFDLYCDPDNTGSVYLGGSDVTSVPANEHLKLGKGVTLNLGPKGSERPFVIDTETWYVVGSAASQVLYVIALADDDT